MDPKSKKENGPKTQGRKWTKNQLRMRTIDALGSSCQAAQGSDRRKKMDQTSLGSPLYIPWCTGFIPGLGIVLQGSSGLRFGFWGVVLGLRFRVGGTGVTRN